MRLFNILRPLLFLAAAHVAGGEDANLGSGGPPDGIVEPVLFRSTQCATADGKVCSGNGLCGTEYNPMSNDDIITCKCYTGYGLLIVKKICSSSQQLRWSCCHIPHKIIQIHIF